MPAKGATVSRLDLDAACAGLRLVDGFADTGRERLEPMTVKGLFHDHVRVAGTPWLLRLPRASQFELGPADNLDYQEACFAHAAPSGSTPALRGRIEPRPGLPWGGLVVAAVEGGPARLPGDLAAMAACLAGIHALPLPPQGGRRPLAVHADPIAGILGFIEPQALYFDRAGMMPAARARIAEELAWARGFAARRAGASQPLALCATDTHPGNFLIERGNDGTRAVFVDLEKALYGSPAIDVAHSTLYTSTMWDADCAAALSRDDVRGFYAAYLDAVPPGLAAALRPWLMPMRRLTWLRTMTWFAKWRVEAEARHAGGAGEPESVWWRAAAAAPGLVADIAQRIDGFFQPDTVARVREEWLGSGAIDFAA